MPEPLRELAHDLIRPLLLGALINSTMTGALLVQIVLYFTRCKRESIWLKCLVVFSGAISCVSVVLASVVVYTRSVLQFGNARGVGSCVSVMTAFMFMPPIQSATVQIFFSWRASRFIGSRAFFVGVIVSAMIQVACSVVSIIVDIFWPSWQRTSKINLICVTWNSLACATDILISVVLIYHLRKRRTGHAESDELLDRVTRFTFQSGVLTAGWAVSSLVLFAASRDSISALLIMAQPSLYANALLAALNFRLKPANDPESAGDSLAGPSEGPEKSPIPVSEVTFISHGIKSEVVTTERRTMDMERSVGMTEVICLDIRRPENN